MLVIPFHYWRRRLPPWKNPPKPKLPREPAKPKVPHLCVAALFQKLDLPVIRRYHRLTQHSNCNTRRINLAQRHRRFIKQALSLRSFRPAPQYAEPTPAPQPNEGDSKLTILSIDKQLFKLCKRKTKLKAFLNIFGLSATEDEPTLVPFDSDSIPIAFDPCATATIWSSKTEFTNLQPVKNTKLSGVGGSINVEGKGTLTLYLEDDLGKRHKEVIEDAYYVPDSPINLVCPQQWAAQRLLRQ
jgi:hypothetical protein